MTIQQITLNPLQPDFDQFLLQLQSQLDGKQSWTDLLTAGSGETLTEFIASIGAFNEFSIERAQQEGMLDTALIPSSIYLISRMLGVHLTRRIPAQVPVQFSQPITGIGQALIIPSYTQFQINGAAGSTTGTVDYFNRDPINFPVGEAVVNGTLYQGQIQTTSYISPGGEFQQYYVGPSDFSLSDLDIYATVGPNSIVYANTIIGLWKYPPTANVFYQNTMPSGLVQVFFGNDIFATSPNVGDQIIFTYAITLGENANDATVGFTVSCPTFSTVTGTTTGAITGGTNNPDPSFYKIMGASLGATGGRAVTRSDYRALAVDYPGVIDAIFYGQAEVNPGDLRWMNIVTVFLLTQQPPWTIGTWNSFANYLTDNVGLATAQYLRSDPISFVVNVNVTLYCFNRVNLSSAIIAFEQAVTQWFTPQLGTLGKGLWTSDLESLALGLADGVGTIVDYLDVLQPTDDVMVQPNQYLTLGTLTVNAAYSARYQLPLPSAVSS